LPFTTAAAPRVARKLQTYEELKASGQNTGYRLMVAEKSPLWCNEQARQLLSLQRGRGGAAMLELVRLA